MESYIDYLTNCRVENILNGDDDDDDDVSYIYVHIPIIMLIIIIMNLCKKVEVSLLK